MIQNEGGEKRVYAGFHDMTKERNQQELLRQQFNELIMQHYREPGPNALIIGHCNITQNKILEIIDHTDSALFRLLDKCGKHFLRESAPLLLMKKSDRHFWILISMPPSGSL